MSLLLAQHNISITMLISNTEYPNCWFGGGICYRLRTRP